MEDKKGSFDTVGSELLIYQTEDGQTKIDVKFEDETVWLTQAQLCELYQTSKSMLWSSFFVTLVAKKYRLATMLPFVPRMVCDSR